MVTSVSNISNKQELNNVVNNNDFTRCFAIRLKCLECKQYKVRDINKCTHSECPLYRYRKGYVK